jgi:hypothetical protein
LVKPDHKNGDPLPDTIWPLSTRWTSYEVISELPGLGAAHVMVDLPFSPLEAATDVGGPGGSAEPPITISMVGVVVEPALFCAVTLNVDVPAVVGVPDRTPFDCSVRPSGSVPEATENVGAGLPVAVNENA